MRRSLLVLSACIGLTHAACAPKPPVSADELALRRVVVYRNGVGYFERAGHVDEDKVTFRVRRSEVGDFLATLAVIERGGSSVRAAAFPIRKPGDDASDETPSDDAHPSSSTADAEKLETVGLQLDGKEHDLQIGYIAETPVWRPSYRLIVHPGGADLQAWGIVQNLSGEDWNQVTLSLIAGAPLAFEASLGTPVIPERPVVTDSGEIIAAVPHAETSLRQDKDKEEARPKEIPAPAMAAAPAPPPASMAHGAAARDRSGPSKKTASAGRRAAGQPVPEPVSMAAAEGAGDESEAEATPQSPRNEAPVRLNPSGPRNLAALAAVAVEGGATRYDIPSPVTVPDQSATMVMLLSKQVPGEASYLFAPDAGVSDSMTHPFRVARFTNVSGGLLERGPIAVFEDGAFLGQGMVDPLPVGATATVPFALERALAVDRSSAFSEEGSRLAKIEAGELTIERDAVIKTKYRVRNGGDAAARVLVKHARAASTRLVNPPKGTDDNVGTGTALVPFDVPGRTTSELLVDERQAVARNADWLSQLADDAVRAYWAERTADAAIATKLKSAWDVRAILVKAGTERAQLGQEKSELESATEETRENLRTLQNNRVAGDLRAQLVERLAKSSLRLETISKRLIELDQQIGEARVRFTEIVRSIKLVVPSPPGLGA